MLGFIGKTTKRNHKNMETTTQATVMDDALKWHFFNLYCLSLSDEEFDLKERQMLYSIGIERGLTPEQINEVVLTTNIAPTVPDTIEGKIDFLYDLVRMAWADGKIEPEEREIIRKCVIRYGFLQENAMDIVDYLVNSVKENKSKTDILNEING